MNKSYYLLISLILSACGGSGGGKPETAATDTTGNQAVVTKPSAKLTSSGAMVTAFSYNTAKFDALDAGTTNEILEIKTYNGVNRIQLQTANNRQTLSNDNFTTVQYANNVYPESTSLYVWGGITPENNMPESGSANYKGNAWAISVDQNQQPSFEKGRIEMKADFSLNELSGNIIFGQEHLSANALIYGNKFASTRANTHPVHIQGQFFGSKAQAIGGAFTGSGKYGIFTGNSND